jgi:hypothetical protein
MRQQPPKEPQGPGKALQPHFHRKGDQPRRLAFPSPGMLPGLVISRHTFCYHATFVAPPPDMLQQVVDCIDSFVVLGRVLFGAGTAAAAAACAFRCCGVFAGRGRWGA